MRRALGGLLIAGLVASAGLVMAQTPPPQPTSEGHPTKWVTTDKSMADYVDEGFELKAVVYEQPPSQSAEPDVHYFLQKQTQLVRCDFRKRETVSIYYCALLTKPK
jgi:hypothetical protein